MGISDHTGITNMKLCPNPQGSSNSPNDQSAKTIKEEIMREFDTGATRDSEDGKFDYEGFLSPYALRRYAEYMNKHRVQSDGKVRDSDNWQKGIPFAAYMKSLWRHLIELWTWHRNPKEESQKKILPEDILCAIIFNASGYLHELTKPRHGRIGKNKEGKRFVVDVELEGRSLRFYTWEEFHNWISKCSEVIIDMRVITEDS